MEIQTHSTTTADYQIQTRTYQGKKYLVVPVVMMVEGVHSGSAGPLLHTSEDLGRMAHTWNGHPVTIGHPQENGRYVSANSPAQLERSVGQIFNAHMSDRKLKAEAWLDEQKLLAISPTALSYIRQGRQLEVSVGVFTEDEPIAGEYNGEHYIAVARNHRPDHLALLPGERGACSWQDGCGVRVNKLQILKLNANEMNTDAVNVMKELARQGYVPIMANEQGYQELMSQIQGKLDSLDNENRYHFLEEVYDDFFVYRVRVRENNETSMYRQSYIESVDSKVEFSGDPVKVRREVNYVQVNMFRRKGKPEQSVVNNANTNEKEKEDKMEEKKSPCCLEKVVQLIANKATHWAEEDREYLLTLEESQLDKMFPREVEEEKEVEKAVEVNKEEPEKMKTYEELLAEASPEDQEMMKVMKKLYNDKKSNLIKHILTHAKEIWTEEKLRNLDFDLLEDVAKSVKAPVDYSVNGEITPTEKVSKSGGKLMPPGFRVNKNEENNKNERR